MSDLRPKGVEIEIGGQKHRLLFTLNAIDEIQEKCNLSLYDAIQYVVKAAYGEMDHNIIHNFLIIVAALINDECDDDLSIKEVGKMIDHVNYVKTARAVMEAFGISMPEPDEDFEDDDDPKVKTGRRMLPGFFTSVVRYLISLKKKFFE